MPHNLLGGFYEYLGQYDKALEQHREALRLMMSGMGYAILVYEYIELNRLEEARSTAKEAQAKNLDSPDLRLDLYALAFLQNDKEGMTKQVDWAAGKPGIEDMLLSFEADTAAYSGRLRKAREFSRWAVDSAERAEEKEVAASHEADAAVREALFGNATEARQRAAAVLALSTGRDVEYAAALALALAGDVGRARTLADDLAKRFPEDTFVWFGYLPTIHAQLALDRNDASKATEALQAAAPYELGYWHSRYIQPTCVGRRIWPVSMAAKPQWSSRKSLTTGGLLGTHLSVHSRFSKSVEPMPCKATPPKPALPIRISSPSGKTPTLMFPS